MNFVNRLGNVLGMNPTNWLFLAIGIAFLIIGVFIYRAFRRKFEKMDGFEGIINERNRRPRREDFDWSKAELERLEKEIEEHSKH